MAFVLATFVGVLTLVLGAYWLFVSRPEQSARAALQHRLRTGRSDTALAAGLFQRARRLSDIESLNSMLKASAGLADPIQRLIDRAGSTITVGAFLLATAVCFTLPLVALPRLKVDLPLTLVVSVIFAAMPYLVLQNRAKRRQHRFEELFPEALELMARALRAGHAFSTSLEMVANEITAPVGPEFRLVYDQQNFGMPLPDALRGLARRVPLIDAKFFVTAVLTQREAGGNLSEVLDNLSKVIRDRFKVKRHVRTVTAHARMTGWVLIGLPPLAALGTALLAPGHIKVLIEDPIGIRMLVVGGVLQILGTLAIRRLVDIEY